MTYHQFVHAVEMKVKGCVSEDIHVQSYVAIKNNNCERRGIMMAEKGINISPTIYLEDYYKEFLRGETIEQIVKHILARYEEVRFQKSWETSFIQSFWNLKQLIVFKVINKERNEELLKNVPYKQVVDLAMVCYVLIKLSNGSMATMLIKNEHLKLWNVTKEEVFAQAEKNSRKLLPARFCCMKDVLAGMLDITIDDHEDDIMYVVSNDEKSFGAACIFYEGVMEMIHSTIRESYYIIPSSVHEVIILPESMAPSKEEIEAMIVEINATQVEDEEILSDHVYFYNAYTKELSM